MTVEIEVGKEGKTCFYINDILFKQVDQADSRILDWILPQKPEFIDNQNRSIEFVEKYGYLELGAR